MSDLELMELTIRDWMVIVGVLLIMTVLLDAWRRVRVDKQARVKMNLIDPEAIPAEPVDDVSRFRELPNGGARVVERGDILRAAGLRSDARASAGQLADGSKQRGPQEEGELIAGMTSIVSGDASESLDWLDGIGSAEDQPAAASTGGKLPNDEDLEVFMLNVVARNPQNFRGEDILHILLACDLRFGEMDFFHRHEFEAGRGAIQFSVANMMQPGVFDIDNMSDMVTPGLVFFLTLPGPEDMMKAFDYMLETAQAVARNLGGDVLDESRSVFTKQAMEHSRQRIRELEQRLLVKAH
ncbi:MAG: cell division protein ZipA [Halioglobus sp.]|nr:cell division protein ZipA [Halioglobus sp.]